MQSVTVAERERGESVRHAVVPELWFVHPIPGFPGLRRFVLVRLDAEADGGVADGAVTDGAVADGAVTDAVVTDVAVAPAVDESPMYELRSLERADVRFMVATPSAFFSDYEIELDDQECGDLGLITAQDALVLVMLTVGRDAASTTANLLAPVVINARTRAAAQIILTGSDWPVRAPLG
jgi:flagellar assembly factor FliW